MDRKTFRRVSCGQKNKQASGGGGSGGGGEVGARVKGWGETEVFSWNGWRCILE